MTHLVISLLLCVILYTKFFFVVDLDATIIYSDHCNEVLDYCSESESDIEPSILSSVWPDTHADSSDDESIDSDQEDPLKYENYLFIPFS